MQLRTSFLEQDWDFDFARTPQFEIRLVQTDAGRRYVLGIAHSSIKVGDHFRRLEWFHPQQVPSQRNGTWLADVQLRVSSLTAFHNALNRVPARMSVGIEFDGDFAPLLGALREQQWFQHSGLAYQWGDDVAAMPKLILTR